MSFFGKNIKKIRIAKKLSQTAFAKLFGLKRTTLGAYEEGRAEAKNDTLIKISDYFKISIDILLKEEITVNQIFGFDSNLLFKNKEIPLITTFDLEAFKLKKDDVNFIKSLKKISLPQEYRHIKIAVENPKNRIVLYDSYDFEK